MLTALGIFVAIIAVLLSFVNFLGPKIVFESDYLFSRVDRNEPFDKECEGRPRRNRKEGKDLLSHPAGITSLHDNFLKGCRTSGDRPLFGTRTIVNGVAGEYQFETYNQVYDKVMMIASGLKDMGITELANIGLYSVNRAEWVIAEHACYAGNWVTVPLYDTLGDEALQYIINLTEMQAIFCSADRIPKLLKNQGSLLSVKSVVLMNHGALDEESLKEIKKASFTVYSFEEVMAKGRNKPMTRVATNLDSVATICFTSGTTGMPKGAIITHGNILSFVAGIEYLGESGAGPLFSKDEVHLSFLPLAHIFERCVQAVLFYYGSVIGFYQGDTLKLLDDVQILKPTIFVAVPRLFNRIHEKVMGNVNAAGGLKKKLFMYAYGVKKANLKKGTVVHKLWDNLIFKQVKNRLGGRVKFMITGSAPISDEVINFLRICFSAYVCEGYGQTETSAGATTTNPYDLTTGHIGQPMPQCMVKLRDVPAMNYTSKDKPYPRGEICIKGNNVFKGYYKDPEKTAETLVNGWNFTGDVGMWDSQGRLLIIDRVKNIFKLSQGEYIAPDRLESVFAHFPAIAQSFVYGDSLQSTLVAVIVPGEGFEIWANKAGFSGKTSELIKSKQVKEQLLIDMAKFGRDHGLKGFELIKNLHFELVPFSIENNLLSPSFKAKRFELKLRYQKELNLLYAEMQ